MKNSKELIHLKAEIEALKKDVARLSPSLRVLLKTRGYELYKKNRHEEPIVPPPEFMDSYYELMGKYSFRLLLRDVIKYKNGFRIDDITKYAVRDVVAEYCSQLLSMGILEQQNDRFLLKRKHVKSFGPTLEWYIAEHLHREYQTEVMWGVSFKRPRVGGDYDVIAKIAWRLLYIEVKSSPPKQIYQSEISAFCERVGDLAPEMAIFFMDTELRMKDKIVPMFEDELIARGKACPVVRLHRELFHIENRIFIVNAKGSVLNNIRRILRWYFLYNNK